MLIRPLRAIAAGIRGLFGRDADEREIDSELRAYLERATADKIASGMEPGRAARDARLELGNLTALREDVRAAGWESVLETIVQDVRFGSRLIRRAPGFSLFVVLTLALGIGGNVAIASLVNTIYFSTLPIPGVERVLRLLDSNTGADGQQRTTNMHSQNVAELQRETGVFQSTLAMFEEDLTLTGDAAPERVVVVFRTAGWRETLGVVPAVGRDFTEDEERRGRDSGVALISDGLWRRRFGGAPLTGAVVHLDGRPFSIVGVMPRGFQFPYEADAWVPVVVNPADRARDFAVFGRMRDGVSAEQARAAVAATSSRIRHEYPETLPGYGIGIRTLRENLVGDQGGTTFALMSIVGFLLLLACVNVATLLMARSVSRRKEFVVRAVLGASRFRQLRQMLTETTLLALAGGAAGVALAIWLGRLTAVLLPENYSQQLGLQAPDVDGRVLGLSLAVSLAVGIAVGLAPALGGLRNANAALKEGGRSAQGDGSGSRRILNGFVVGQMALALVLLAAAGLMLQDLRRLQHRDLGFAASGLLTMVSTPSPVSHPRDPARARFLQRLEDEIAVVPGVGAIGTTTVNPLGGTSWGTPILIEGRGHSDADTFNINHRLVSPGLFAAMGIPIVRGRGFTWADDRAHMPVAIVSDRLARRFWPGDDAIGKRVRVAGPGTPWLTVVGIAANVHDARDPGDPEETWYLPYAQNAAGRAADDLHLMVRTTGDPEALASAVQAAVWRVDRNLPVYQVTAMDRFYSESLARERLGTVVTLAFGAFGLLLAALGVYGVMAFAVAARTPEIGMRMALGADRGSILGLMLGRGARLTAIGLLVGCAAAALVNRILSGFLPDLHPLEPLVLALAPMVLMPVSLLASYVPARRAARLDPLVALRNE